MSYRAAQILTVVGGMLVLVGLGGLVSSFYTHATDTKEISAGPERFAYHAMSLFSGGSLHVEYAVTTEGTVDVFVFTEAQYHAYVNAGSRSALYSESERGSGRFDVSLPGPGRYYVAFDHGDAHEGTVQSVRMTIRLLGIEPISLLGGTAVLLAGLIVAVVGLATERRPVVLPA